MGAQVAKPNPPPDNEAKANNDLAVKGLTDTAQRFLDNNRLGIPSGDTLGYPMTDDKLIAQELRLLTQTQSNVPSDQIEKTIDDLFSGDWKSVVSDVASALAVFFSGEVPAPSEEAVYNKFQKSYLRFENGSIVQYSVLVVQTNAKSTGTLTADTQTCLQTAICKGIVDYAGVDPQNTIFQLRASDPTITADQVTEILKQIEQELTIAAKLAKLKKQLEYDAGGGKGPSVPVSLDDVKLDAYNGFSKSYQKQTYATSMNVINQLREQIKTEKMPKFSAGTKPINVDLCFGGASLGTLQLLVRN